MSFGDLHQGSHGRGSADVNAVSGAQLSARPPTGTGYVGASRHIAEGPGLPQRM